ncbi:MAG: HesB/YadR/YfhF family protein [Bacillus sp. (in: firmicutes)]
MNIHLTDEAITWFEDELDLQEGDSIRFFARYGGTSTHQAGFSLGMEKETPISIGASLQKNGIQYFIEENDLWYFNNLDLCIHFNSEKDEITYLIE